MAKPRLVLHIGTEKTGTTHTQRFLKLNRERLTRFGIALGPEKQADYLTYIAALNRWPYRHNVYSIQSQKELDAFQTEYWSAIENLSNSDVDTVFLSYESLCNLPLPKIIEFFEKISDHFDSVAVFGFFRRADSYVPSFYYLTVWKAGHFCLTKSLLAFTDTRSTR